jgi:hypothetical protein
MISILRLKGMHRGITTCSALVRCSALFRMCVGGRYQSFLYCDQASQRTSYGKSGHDWARLNAYCPPLPRGFTGHCNYDTSPRTMTVQRRRRLASWFLAYQTYRRDRIAFVRHVVSSGYPVGLRLFLLRADSSHRCSRWFGVMVTELRCRRRS